MSKPSFLFHSGETSTGSSSSDTISLAAVLVLLLAGTAFSGFLSLSRYLNKRSPETLLHGYMTLMLVVVVTAFAVDPKIFFFSLNAENVALTATCVFLLYLGQIAQATGLKYEGATIGAILANSELFFAFLMDATLLANAVDLFSIVGAAIIFCATVGLVLLRGGIEIQKTHKRRRWSPLRVDLPRPRATLSWTRSRSSQRSARKTQWSREHL